MNYFPDEKINHKVLEMKLFHILLSLKFCWKATKNGFRNEGEAFNSKR